MYSYEVPGQKEVLLELGIVIVLVAGSILLPFSNGSKVFLFLKLEDWKAKKLSSVTM